jgi:hypothetical protein
MSKKIKTLERLQAIEFKGANGVFILAERVNKLVDVINSQTKYIEELEGQISNMQSTLGSVNRRTSGMTRVGGRRI